MAIIQPIHGSMRGRIGANVWSHNKGGDYVRLGTTPTNPNSSRQQAARGFLGDLAQAWNSTLTAAQRDNWNTYAQNHPVENSLGQEIYLTGLNWYVKINARLWDAGDTLLTNPPVGSGPGALTTLSVDVSAATTIDVTYTAALGATERMQLWSSLPGSAGSSPNFKQCRLVGYSAAQAASPIAFTSPFGIQSGDTVRVFACKMDDEGLIGPYLDADDTADY
jgi:hypothetical protein